MYFHAQKAAVSFGERNLVEGGFYFAFQSFVALLRHNKYTFIHLIPFALCGFFWKASI